jgi:hypothetical protein
MLMAIAIKNLKLLRVFALSKPSFPNFPHEQMGDVFPNQFALRPRSGCPHGR